MISQKNQDKFFIQMNISVWRKNILLKNYFNLKYMTRIMSEPLYHNPFYMFIKILVEIIKKIAPKIYPKKNTFFFV
jgi:hypothetical protein